MGMAVVAIGLILLRGSRTHTSKDARVLTGTALPPAAPVRRGPCTGCGHTESEHVNGTGRCRHEYGDARWGNDSYGSDWQHWSTPEFCDCPGFGTGNTAA